MTQDAFGGDERDASFQTLADIAYALDGGHGGDMPILEALDHAVAAFPIPEGTADFEFYAVSRFVEMLRRALRIKLFDELDAETRLAMRVEGLARAAAAVEAERRHADLEHETGMPF